MARHEAMIRTDRGRRERFKFLGGALCLDFVNTLERRGAGDRLEWLPAYDDLLRWSVIAGNLDTAGAARLTARARRDPEGAAAAHRAALALREALYAIFAARIDGGRVPAKALAALNAALAEAPARHGLTVAGPGFAWSRDAGRDDFGEAMGGVVWSAGDLLTSDRIDRLKRCADPSCGWLFLDESRTGRRRWCAMAGCGNRAKARRHHARRIARNSAV